MAITQTYCDYATGNDYIGASFTDGAFTVADMTLTKAGAFAASKANHWLYLDDNGSGEVTTGYYRIASVTSPNAVVLADSPKSGANDPTDVVCAQAAGTTILPFRSVQGALDFVVADTNGAQINVQAGTAQVNAAALDLTTYLATNGALAVTKQMVIRGYTSAANDGGVAEIDCGGAAMFASSAAVNYVHLVDLEIHTFGDNHGVALNNYSSAYRCEIHKGASTPSGKNLLHVTSSYANVTNCYVHGSGNNGKGIVGTGSSYLSGNYVSDCDCGIDGGAYGTVSNNIVRLSGVGAIGIRTAGYGARISGNIIYQTTAGTAYGILEQAHPNVIIANNIIVGFSGAGGEGIYLDGGVPHLCGHNAFYNCTSNYTATGQVFIDLTANDVALGADPFTDAANGDFSLTVAAKAALADAGFPGQYLGAHANTDSHLNIGPIQLTATACDYPAEADVQDGVTFGSGSYTGTFEAPPVAKVIDDTSYGADGTEFTGTYKAVAAADVEAGVTFGAASAETGTYDPMAAAVFPAEANTLEAEAAYGPTGAEYAGTYHAPEVSEVVDTASFGAASAETGTVHLPDAAEVIDTAAFGAGSAVAGTYHEAEAAEVQLGVTFGPSETYTGTLVAGGGVPDWTDDEKKQIRQALGVTGTTAATEATGDIKALPSAATIKTAIEADGSKLDHLWEMTEDDGGVRRLTGNALEQAPASGTDTPGVTELLTRVPDATPGAIGGLPLSKDASGRVEVASATDKNTLDSVITAIQGADGDTLKDLSDEIALVGGAADPLLNPVPGAYAAGTAGYIIGSLTSGVVLSIPSPVSGSTITATIAATLAATLTGLTISADWAKVYLTVKRHTSDTDAQSLLQVVVSNPAAAATDGTLYVNGAAASVAQRTQAAITVTQATGVIAIAIDEALTGALREGFGLAYDLKELTTSGAANVLAQGTWNWVHTATWSVT